MAAAVCGLQSNGGNGKPAKTHREHRRKAKDSRRRQAALLFLSNISLDGRPHSQLAVGNAEQKVVEEPRLGDRDGRAPDKLQPADSQGAGVTDPDPNGTVSSSSLPGILSPIRPSLVTSPGPSTVSSVGPNDVFLEGSSAVEARTPDTPLSPVPAVHQPCSRTKSTPAVLSPVPAGNSLDSRQR